MVYLKLNLERRNMASFVVQHTTGMYFLNELEKENIKISKKDCNDFLLSNLIADYVNKKAK